MTQIPAGAIAPRTPKPLSAKQRKRLRKQVGGFATAQQLQSLADAFAKPDRRAA
jgi:hypothetical protein